MDDKHADHDAVDADDNTAAVAMDRPDTDLPATDTGTAPDATRQETDRSSLADLDDPGHLFDQTNGLAQGLDGDGDGTSEAEANGADEAGGRGVNPGTDAGTGIIGFNTNDRI
jgi:hypothetical protein